jgi:hypothetical protein
MSESAQVVATIAIGGVIALTSYVVGLARRRARTGRRAAGRPFGTR